MVMFKARFHAPEPVPNDGPGSSDDGDDGQPQVPPIEKERGPQAPIREPEEKSPPQRVGRARRPEFA